MRLFSKPGLLVGLLVVALLAVSGIFIVSRIFAPTSKREIWIAKNGKPTPDKFCYLLVPRGSTCELLNRDGSSTNRVLDRAVMCSWKELAANGRLSVWDQGTEFYIEKSKLTHDPSGPQFNAFVTNWKRTVTSWGDETDWPNVDVQAESVAMGEARVSLTRRHRKGDIDTFVYLVRGGAAIPESWIQSRALFDFAQAK